MTYLTVAADDLSSEVAEGLSEGGYIDGAALAEMERAGEHVADPAEYLAGRDGWHLDADGHSHWHPGMTARAGAGGSGKDGGMNINGVTVDRPRCLACGRKLRRERHGFNPEDPKFGDYGDGAFCGLTCGYNFAVWIVGWLNRHDPYSSDGFRKIALTPPQEPGGCAQRGSR